MIARIPLVLLVGALLVSLAAAASAPTFCKCTCFSNSEIIELRPQQHNDQLTPPTTPPSPAGGDSHPPPSSEQSSIAEARKQKQKQKRAASPSCGQCNRAFCRDYNLPICRGAEEKDVVTMCFQRDSRKDQIIVWGFIIGTAGLLGWAGLQRVLEMREAGGWFKARRAGGPAAAGGRGTRHRGGGRSGSPSPGLIPATAGGAGGRGPLRSPQDAGSRGNYQPVGPDPGGRSSQAG